VLRPAPIAALSLALALGCTDGGPQQHVFIGTPPRPTPPAAATVVTVPAQVPEAPLGSFGPAARITGVLDAATGRPATLTAVTDSVDLVTVAARGQATSRSEAMQLRLTLSGPRETTLVLRVAPPTPAITAHPFRIVLADGAGGPGLADGHYRVQARIVLGGRTLATSMPIFLTVKAH
jgi:hypothetical protein